MIHTSVVADEVTDAMKIRNKRLAKLSSQAPASSSSGGEGSNSDSAAPPSSGKAPSTAAIPERNEQPSTKINISSSSDISSNPFAQLGLRTGGDGPRINIKPASGGIITPQKRDSPGSGNAKPGSRSDEPLEVWEDRILSAVFRITLDQDIKQDSQGHHLNYVGSVRKDLEDQGEPIRLSTEILDQAILEAASNVGKITPLDYLLACWKRVSKQYKAFRSGSAQDPRYNLVKEARRLCMSYCMFAVTMPDMFG